MGGGSGLPSVSKKFVGGPWTLSLAVIATVMLSAAL